MEGLQHLFKPSLENLLISLQQADVLDSKCKPKKRTVRVDDSQQRKKRNRITFDAYQVDEMEKVFAENQYPDALGRDALAAKILLDEERIWFQNRRAKYRRELRHTYHPYEPPKEVEYPFFKKAIVSVSRIDNDNTDNTTATDNTANAKTSNGNSGAASDKDHPPMTEEKTSLAVASQEIGDQSIFMKALVDSADESVDLNAMATSLSLLLPGSQNTDQNITPPGSETSESSTEELETFEQIDSEKAGLLLWALSSIFNVQNEATA